MIYLKLFLGFLRVGLFSFGGAYAAIPLIRDVVLSYGWLTDAEMANMIAVSESTPGPIMVNLATYVGSSQGGLLGAVIATFAVVLPAFIIILLIMAALRHFMEKGPVKAVIGGLTPCITGIILAVGAYMIYENLLAPVSGFSVSLQAFVITLILAAILAVSRFVFKKKFSPILLIVIAAVLGMVVYSV